MRNELSIKVVGLSVSALLAVTFVLSVLVGLLIPGSGMMAGSGPMAFPSFGWGMVGFVLGLVWSVTVGFYVAGVFVPIDNYLQRREARATPAPTRQVGEQLPAHR